MTTTIPTHFKKILLIALIIFIPVIGALIGRFAGTWYGVKSIRASEEWKSLGTPPEKPNQLLGLCENEICVKTKSGKEYRYDCVEKVGQACWVEVVSAKIEPIIPQLYNPCMYEIQMPSPPADTIQVLGAKLCGSGGDIYSYYALLEDGSVWKWEHSIFDLAPLVAYFGVFTGIIMGFGLGIVIAISIFAFGWPRVNRRDE